MDKAAKIKEWCSKNTEPIQGLCPCINQSIHTSKGWEMWNSRTGIRKVIHWNPQRWGENREHGAMNVFSPRSYSYEALYVRYIKELGALELSHVCMTGNRGKNGEPREWYYGTDGCYQPYSRLFLFDGETTAYTQHGEALKGGKYYSQEVKAHLHEWQRRSICSQENVTELKKFQPDADLTMPYGDPEHVYMYQFVRWYEKRFIKRNKSKKYTELTSYELEDMTMPLAGYGDKCCYFQKLDDKNAVIRVFIRSRYYYDCSDAVKETPDCCRIYVSNKGKPTIMVKEGNQWVIKAQTPWGATGDLNIVNPTEMWEWLPLKYIKEVFDDRVSVERITAVLRHPIIEQMYKAGYPKTAAQMLNHNGEIKAWLRDNFSVESERKLPLYKLLGCNKFLLKAIEYSDGNMPQIARELKYYYGEFDVSKAPEEIVDMIAAFLNNDRYGRIEDYCPDRARTYYYRRRFDNRTPLTDDDRKWLMKLYRMEKKHVGCCHLYKDVVSTYQAIQNKPDIDMYDVRGYDDMERLHNALVAIQVRENEERRAYYNAQEAERIKLRQKTFEKLQDERIEKFEFENDDWAIRVPKELSDIEKEGCVLHHCVGGYVDRHARGETNIIFLRRKADEDMPFFTIEIDNNNRVVQIHGSHNRWLGNEPTAVPFVYTYLEKLGAKYDKKVLLNKGAGYSAGSEELDKSYLKIIA